MRSRRPKILKRFISIVSAIILSYFIINAVSIYNYSFKYSENKSDVAIVLGAGTSNGRISPVFAERINHSKYLYNKGLVKMIILTGGYGEGQKESDSEVAKKHLLNQGIPMNVILIEKRSRFTIENLEESKRIMDSLSFKSALIISDPLHMKRSMAMAEKVGINGQPSPTKTTMYRSFYPKAKSLIYETFYFSLREITGKNQ
ncbi:MAG: YdcF family protein [Bacteroidota bacterium]